MSRNNEVSEPEDSPRSKFGKFFSRRESKKGKDEISDRKKTFENESSQTQNNIGEPNNVENIEEKRKINSQDILKAKSTALSEEKPEKLLPDGETRKLIANELNPKKITALINNSIKEAVRSIVKDGVCEFVESHEKSENVTKKSKDKEANKIPDIIDEATLPKDNIKSKSTYLTSEEKKTFDSHSRGPARIRKSPSPYKSPGRITEDQCDHLICPAYNLEEIKKPKKHQNEKTKRKAHFSTDNRRMTGNVNIYICSEANENKKCQSQDKNKVIECSETDTDMKSSESSVSSVSTTKLVNALKKKRRKKLDAQDLECLCEEPEDIIEDLHSSTKRLSEVPDNGIMSSSDRVQNLHDDISSTEFVDECSLKNCPTFSVDTQSNYEYSHYDNNSWDPRRSSMKNYSSPTTERDQPVRDTPRESVCSCKCSKPNRMPCCICESEKQFATIATNYPEERESVTVCTKEPITEEGEENQCCDCKKDSIEEFTVCGLSPASLDNDGGVTESIKTDTDTIARATGEIKNESMPSEQEVSIKPNESDLVTVPDNKGRESFLLRSWKKAITLVKRPKTTIPEVQSDERKALEKRETVKNSTSKLKNDENNIQSKKGSSSTLNTSLILKEDKKSKIVSRISSKQKQKELTVSDSKIASSLNLAKPKSPISSEKLTKSKDENKNSLEFRAIEPDNPKVVPCTFSKQEEPQERKNEECCIKCNKIKNNCDCCKICCESDKSSECRCPPRKPKEPTCCTCKRNISCCACREAPIFKSPKSCQKVCRFCCNPLNRCTCRAPIRKCSYCGMSSDICNCHEGPLWTEGRPIMIPEKNNGIHVTAWKPRPEIAAYFSRERMDLQGNKDNCHCDKNKPCGLDELPYQKLNVFSNVMTELQQKISDSVYCSECNNTLCCCPKLPNCLSEIPEKPSSKCRKPLPIDCKCPRPKRKITTFAICDICRTSPCRCRKDKRPQAKCFYCKTMPCRCEWKNKRKTIQLTETRAVNPRLKRLRGCQCPSPETLLDQSGDNYTTIQRHR